MASSDHDAMDSDDSFSSLLELAANNDLPSFQQSLRSDPSAVDELGLWYVRKAGSNHTVLHHRTPLAVAAAYASLDVLRFILSLSPAPDVNRPCGQDRTTALHCAASSGSPHAVDAVEALLAAGADPNSVDANGDRPGDLILVSPKLTHLKPVLEELLGCPHRPLYASSDDDASPNSDLSPNPTDKKEYPIDPSLPDIKNSIYSTDEFRMFSFKVRPCSRAYSHDWTECPFVHPGENARRRDPRKFHYSCVPCPDFRKGACRRGDMCEYAHGVFECWLHPAQYRTRLCKDGTGCARRVCFFAHTSEELRPLYMSTGSAVPSPRTSAASQASALELAAAIGLVPSSPSFTPPMSPSGGPGGWPQPNVPALHLPGSNFQSSRLRSSLNARDMIDDYAMMTDFEAQQLLSDLCASRFGNRSARSKTLTPSNLDELFSGEVSLSPRYGSEQGAVFSPSHKSAILNQFQQQQQSLLSPINTGVFSPKSIDAQQMYGLSSPGRMSPRSVEPVSPMSARLAAIVQREKQQSLRSLSSRELGARAAAAIGSPVESSWSKWGSPSGMLEWGVDGEELGRLRRSSSFELRYGGEEPDLSWVHSLVKESPTDKLEAAAAMSSSGGLLATGGAVGGGGVGNGSNANSQMDAYDHTAALGAWLEQMQLDQMVA